jgi:flagellar basal-body rod modification protein FlgD
MDIRSISDVQAANAAAASAATGASSGLGKDAFLNLLVTQMKYQDPLSPMDNAQFAAQLAQFSSLEQLVQVNTNLTALGQSQGPAAMASANGFIGREILARGDAAVLGTDGSAPIQFSLDAPAATATVLIQGSDGSTARALSLTGVPGGANQVNWDGLDNTGTRLPAGSYRFSVVAQDAAGSSVTTHTEVNGLVAGTVYDGSTPYLVVGDRQVALTDVVAVKEPVAAAQ